MIDIAPLVAFLVGHASTGKAFKKIEDAYEIQLEIDDYAKDLPYLGVFPGSDTAGEDGADNLSSNSVNMQTHVYLMCKLAEAVALEAALHTAMFGYNAGSAFTDIELVSADTNGLKNGVIWREYVYSNNIVIREAY